MNVNKLAKSNLSVRHTLLPHLHFVFFESLMEKNLNPSKDFFTIADRRSVISGVSEGVVDTSDIAAGTVCSYEFIGPFPDSEVRFNFTNKAMGGGGLLILDGNKGALHGRPVKIYRVVQRISNKLPACVGLNIIWMFHNLAKLPSSRCCQIILCTDELSKETRSCDISNQPTTNLPVNSLSPIIQRFRPSSRRPSGLRQPCGDGLHQQGRLRRVAELSLHGRRRQGQSAVCDERTGRREPRDHDCDGSDDDVFALC